MRRHVRSRRKPTLHRQRIRWSSDRNLLSGPPAIVAKLQREVAKVLTAPGVVEKANASRLFPVATTTAECAAFIRQEAWSKILSETSMRYD
jgi:hypothetical protein